MFTLRSSQSEEGPEATNGEPQNDCFTKSDYNDNDRT